MIKGPTIAAVRESRQQLSEQILTTPVWRTRSPIWADLLGVSDPQIWFKIELWQRGGSFKTRAALLGIMALTAQQRERGVVAISAGNHAIAVAYSAKQLNISAKVLMPKTASPVRIARCKYYGAQVQLAENMQELFDHVASIQEEEGRTLIHPFDGEKVALGTGTLALEMHEQIGDLDAVIVAIGGGGLIGGVSNAYKQLQPGIKVYGVEPEGAAVMSLSFQAGKPVPFPKLNTIADSLSVPKTEIYPYELCRQHVDKIVTVSDENIINGMRFLFNEMKLAVEPAAAIGLTALFGPLRDELAGKRVGIILSGTNIDERKYCNFI